MGKRTLFLSLVAASSIHAATINFTNSSSYDTYLKQILESSMNAGSLASNIIEEYNINTIDFFTGEIANPNWIYKDDINVYGTKDNILNIKQTPYFSILGNNASINYANINALNLDLGDDVFLKSLNNVYYKTNSAKQYNNKAIATINNSNINGSRINANKLNINNSVLNGFNIHVNELNTNNSTFDASNGGMLYSLIKTTGTNNDLIVKNGSHLNILLKGDVPKSFFNIKSSDAGISSIEPTLIYVKSKDGYTIFTNIGNSPEEQKRYENFFQTQ